MNNNGWIAVHRKLKEKGYYKDSEVVHIWLHLLLSVNHRPNEFMWNGVLTTIGTGQMVTGRKAIAEATGINEHKVDRSLELLERCGQIKQQKTTKNRLITVINWEKHQVLEQQLSNKRATTEQQLSTNNNDNNINNDNKGEVTPSRKASNFFLKVRAGEKEYIEFITALSAKTKIPLEALSREVKKFSDYWTEKDFLGKKERWQKQQTFEVDKRLNTWLQNASKFSGAGAPRGKQII